MYRECVMYRERGPNHSRPSLLVRLRSLPSANIGLQLARMQSQSDTACRPFEHSRERVAPAGPCSYAYAYQYTGDAPIVVPVVWQS